MGYLLTVPGCGYGCSAFPNRNAPIGRRHHLTKASSRCEQRTIVLRASLFPDRPATGAFFYTPSGVGVFQINGVTRISTAGRYEPPRYRLAVTPLALADVPLGTPVLPWPSAESSRRRGLAEHGARGSADPGPPESHAARLARIRSKAPLLLQMSIDAIRRGRTDDSVARLARAARVGADDGVKEARDLGPGLRLRPVRGKGGIILRGPDTMVEDGPDPNRPAHNVRRARRIDPLLVLFRSGKITERMHDAAEELRAILEGAEPSIPPTGSASISVPAHQRAGVADRQLLMRTKARQAMEAISTLNHGAVLWVVVGGSIAGFARFTRVRDETASGRLKDGLEQLAIHFYGRS